jgi:hypothetical protein
MLIVVWPTLRPFWPLSVYLHLYHCQNLLGQGVSFVAFRLAELLEHIGCNFRRSRMQF